jgi:hypothetical protein
MSHMMELTLHVMVPIITLFGTLKFYLLFKFNIYKKTDSTDIILDNTNITYEDTYITFDGTN